MCFLHGIVSTTPLTLEVNSRLSTIVFHPLLEPQFTCWMLSSDSSVVAMSLSLFSQSILNSNVFHNLVEPSVLALEHYMRLFLELLGDLFSQLTFHTTVLPIVPLLILTSDDTTFLLKLVPVVLRTPSTHDVFSF